MANVIYNTPSEIVLKSWARAGLKVPNISQEVRNAEQLAIETSNEITYEEEISDDEGVDEAIHEAVEEAVDVEVIDVEKKLKQPKMSTFFPKLQ